MSAAHKVVPGDTLSKIAAANGVTLQQLLAANPQYKTNPNLIRVGDVIKIPQPKLSPNQPAGTASVPCAPQKKTPQELRKEAAEAVFPGHQHFGNCGLQSARQIIEQARGACLSQSEEEFLNESIANNEASYDDDPYKRGGSSLGQNKALLERYGIQSDVKYSFTDSGLKEDITEAIKNKKGIIIAADPGVLWSDPQYEGFGHAVTVTDGEFDAAGNLTNVWINDTGDGQRKKIKTNELMAAIQARSGPSQILVTEQPIWP